MAQLVSTFDQKTTSGKDLSFIRPGVTLRVHQKIQEGEKSRIQVYEGLVIAQKHGYGPNGTVTVRKVSNGIGVERTFPLHSPNIEQFEPVKASKVRRAKLYYIADKTAREQRKKTRILEEKTKQLQQAAQAANAPEVQPQEEPMEEHTDNTPETDTTQTPVVETVTEETPTETPNEDEAKNETK